MTKLVQTLERKKGFSETESVIASYLLKNFRQLPTMSTRQLARATFCSPAAIVRFCQKLGFGGYTEFRVKFLAEMLQNVENPKILDFNMDDKDTVQSLLEKVTGIEIEAIRNTRSLLDPSLFVRAFSLIHKCRHVDFYAMDDNLHVANMAASSFIMANKCSTVHMAMTMQYLQATAVGKDHLAFFISRTGENRMLIDIAQLLKIRGLHSVLITGAPDSTLGGLADVVFPVSTVDTMQELGPRVFLLTAQYVINVIFAALMTRIDYGAAKEKDQWLSEHFYY